MMRQGVVLATLLLFFSVSAQAKSHHKRDMDLIAHAVVCKNTDGSIKSAELLDMYEARTKYELSVVTQGPDIDSNVAAVQKKLTAIFKDVGMKTLPSTYIDEVAQSISSGEALLQKGVLPEAEKNLSTTPIPQGCELLATAFYENQSDLSVYTTVFESMDGINRAAMIAHAAVYRHESELGEVSQERIRKIVAHLFSSTKILPLKQDIPQDANTCRAVDKYDATKVMFEFFKYDSPKSELHEVLQFTKFRGVYPYGLTRIISPKWAWPKEDGDLFLTVESDVEQFSELYIRREWTTTGVLDKYYFDELNGDFEVRCSKHIDAEPAILKIVVTSNYEPVAVGGTRVLNFEISNIGKGKSLAMSASGLASPFGFLGDKYPGTGGTCGTSLQAGAMCSLKLVFAPTTSGTFSDTLVINFNDGTSKQQMSIDVEGTSLAPALLTISDSNPYNFGLSANGSSRDKSFTISNKGGIRASSMTGANLSSPFVFKGGKFPGIGGSCGVSLEANATCSVVVSYEPTTVGKHEGKLTISYASGAVTSTVTRDLAGATVTPALLTITEMDPYDFGTVATGASKTLTLTVTNVGEFAASSITGTGLAAPFSFAGNYYPGKNGTCYSSLSPGAKCTIVLQYSPTGSGTASDSVEMIYNNGAGVQVSQRLFTGVGAAPAFLVVSDGPNYKFGFAYPGTTLEHVFTITNTGAAVATNLNPTLSNGPFSFAGNFPGKGGTCGKTLAATSSCTFVITFAPDQVGTYQDSFKLTYNNGVQNTATSRDVSGLAGQAAELVMTTGTVYNFGETALGATKEIELMIVNTGGSAATLLQDAGGLAAPYSYKGGTYPGIGGTCGNELAINADCTVVVSYVPQKTGEHKETLALSYFNGHAKKIVLQYFDGTGVSETRSSWEPWNFFALTDKK